MSEWNRRDRDDGQRRYGHQEDRNRQGYGGQDGWNASGGYGDEQRSFGQGGRGEDRRSYEDDQTAYERYGASGRGDESYGRSGQGGGYQGGRQSGQGYRSSGGQSYGGGRGYDERDQDGLAYYGLGPFGSGQHPGSPQYGGRPYGGGQYGRSQQYGGGGQQYGGRQQDYGQGGGAMGHNERLERVSDGEADRHGFFGGGMMRGGEHRGRGPKNYTRSDDRIREDVNDRLSDDAWLDASEIDVQVSSCEVTLTGTVNSREDKRRAEDVVEQVSGVKHVQNNLRVQSQAATSQATTQGAAGVQGSSASQDGKPGSLQ